jgi:hypothetical protein
VKQKYKPVNILGKYFLAQTYNIITLDMKNFNIRILRVLQACRTDYLVSEKWFGVDK